MAQHRFGLLQRPVLPGDGHEVDRVALLMQGLPEAPCAIPQERRPLSVACPGST